jgi:4-carboxymuconolactone decarboxylase
MATTPNNPERLGDPKPARVARSGRLPQLIPTDLDPTQRAFYDSMAANEVPWAERGGALAMADDGSLLGPFNPLLFSPAISAAMLEVFRADKNHSSLPGQAHEIVVLTVGAAWRAEYELYAHRAIGKAQGLPAATIGAIVAGARPEFDSEQDESAYDFTWQLTHHHAVDEASYRRAVAAFGEAGVVDMVMLIGLYITVCAIVNAFDVPVPGGARLSAVPGDEAR